jgi:hypothetical protein
LIVCQLSSTTPLESMHAYVGSASSLAMLFCVLFNIAL